MAKPKQTRWKCPRCEDGKLAPTRPRKDDVRRYCIPCSEETGRLVERVAPALEKKRTAARERSQAKAAAKARREREDAHARKHVRLWDAAGRLVEIDPVADTYKLAAMAGFRRRPRVTWNRGSRSGHSTGPKIHLSIGGSLEDYVTLALHELAHSEAGAGNGHNRKWIQTYADGAKAAVGAYIPVSLVNHRYRDTDPRVTTAACERSKKLRKPIVGRALSAGEILEIKVAEARRAVRAASGFNVVGFDADGERVYSGWHRRPDEGKARATAGERGFQVDRVEITSCKDSAQGRLDALLTEVA